MKPKDKVERFVAETRIGTSDKRDRQVLGEVLQVHEGFKHRQSQEQRPTIWRTFMTRPRRVAATVALALLLIGTFSFDGGSVAFSQVGHAVSFTLSMLKNMITGTPVEEQRTASPAPAQDTDSNRRKIFCEARFFAVSEADQNVWRRLEDQGIKFIEASANPEAYYATLSREQAQSFGASITLKCIATPRVLFLEGDGAAIAASNPEAGRGLAIGLKSEVSSDGKHIQSTLSFHDGLNGFEIPDVNTETGGAILIRTRGMFPGEDENSKEFLIRVQIEVQ